MTDYSIKADPYLSTKTKDLLGKAKELCGTCHRPYRKRCWGGVLEYDDGSSMACENWNIRLDEIGGMTTEEAEAESRYRAQFR